MNNIYLYFIAIVSLLQIYGNVLVSNKIDCTISMINQELIVSCVTEDSKLMALEYDDISLLEIDHGLLINVVDSILKDNLNFTNTFAKYYFYDSISLINCPIRYHYCNSVQMLILVEYGGKTYERTLRYEPIKT